MKKTFYEVWSDCGEEWKNLLDELLKPLIDWLNRKLGDPEGE